MVIDLFVFSSFLNAKPLSGEPSEGMCYRNIEAAYKYLREERNIPPSQIVLYGRSLGSGPSCHLARKTALDGESVAGVILHSPFLSIYRIVMDFGFGLVGDMFRNKNNAKDIRYAMLLYTNVFIMMLFIAD
jgi:hypothetical protein